MPGEGLEEDYDEVEEVEEEAPKVRPGQVADERNAATKGKLELCAGLPTSEPAGLGRVLSGTDYLESFGL